MELSGKKILVDGFNLELSQGTGIKTYGVSLVQALSQLGAKVDVLFSRSISQSQDPLLDEILFFDTTSDEDTYAGRIGRLRKYRDLVGIFYKAVAKRPYKAKYLKTSDRVIKEPVRGSFVNSVATIINLLDIHNLQNCYIQANSIFKYFKQETNIALEDKIDVFHATYPLPVQITGARKITTIHDLIPLRLPYTTLDKKPFYYDLIKQTLKGSDAIVTVSENSRNDILDLFDINPDKVKVTYQPITLNPIQEDAEMIGRFLRKYNLQYNNYILFVGAIEPKKNVRRLIDAYLQLDTDVPLILVGKLGWLWSEEIGQIVDAPGKEFLNIRFLDYVSSDDLRFLFAGATCFTFPSLYEGFGLPILEAMSLGCPVITSNASSLPEIGGDAALYVDPYDISSIHKQLSSILSDAELRKTMIEKGFEQAQKFSMENYLKRLSDVYSSVM